MMNFIIGIEQSPSLNQFNNRINRERRFKLDNNCLVKVSIRASLSKDSLLLNLNFCFFYLSLDRIKNCELILLLIK